VGTTRKALRNWFTMAQHPQPEKSSFRKKFSAFAASRYRFFPKRCAQRVQNAQRLRYWQERLALRVPWFVSGAALFQNLCQRTRVNQNESKCNIRNFRLIAVPENARKCPILQRSSQLRGAVETDETNPPR